jgi:ribose transport system substrate-binding protein
MDGTATGPYTTDFQTTDNQAAQQAVRAVVAKLGGSCGNVAIIQGSPQNLALKARNDGFATAANAAGCKIVAQQINPLDDPAGGRKIADALKAKYGSKLRAIFANNDESATGAASAFGAGFKPVMVSINGDQSGIDAVRRGQVVATFDYRPVEIGNAMAVAVDQIIRDKRKLPPTIKVEMTKYDSQNVGQWVPPSKQLAAPLKVTFTSSGSSTVLQTTQ